MGLLTENDFWDVTSCLLVNRYFKGVYNLRLYGEGVARRNGRLEAWQQYCQNAQTLI
jgi:hypothetical protein